MRTLQLSRIGLRLRLPPREVPINVVHVFASSTRSNQAGQHRVPRGWKRTLYRERSRYCASTPMNEYASLQRRSAAWILDTALMLPIAVGPLLDVLWQLPAALGFATAVAGSLLPFGYKIVTQALWGQTIGKRLLRIQLLQVDGSHVRWSQMLNRYAPGLVFFAATTIEWCMIVQSAGWERVRSAGYVERGELILAASPDRYTFMETWVPPIWLVLNLIVLGKSVRNQALHDLVAGTVVCRKPRDG